MCEESPQSYELSQTEIQIKAIVKNTVIKIRRLTTTTTKHVEQLEHSNTRNV